jgi:EmrB/QacA subfamily drug resistance transporter
MIVLDSTVTNVALPSIQKDLGFSQASLAWVVNDYLVAFGGLLLLAGRLGDLIGRRKVFLIGLVLFTLASLLCGVANSQELLIAARFVQGVGGAFTSAVVLGMIVTMFPGEADRARAIGLYSFVASAGASIGLLAGGVLTQSVNWHAIFFVNLPIGVGVTYLATRLIDDEPGIGLSEGADGLGATLVTASLMLGVYTIVSLAENDSGMSLILGGVSIALLVGFIARQATAARPLLPLGIFRSRRVSGANAAQMLMVAGMFGIFFMGSLYMQRVLEYSPLEIGLAFLPCAGIIGALSYEMAGQWATRFGARRVLLVALPLIGLALGLMALAPVDGQYLTNLFPSMVLMGIGCGLAFPALGIIAMADATPENAGLASGLIGTTSQVGGALGLAVLAALAGARTADGLGGGASLAAALTDGYHAAFLLSLGLVAACFALVAGVLRTLQTAGEGRHSSRVD